MFRNRIYYGIKPMLPLSLRLGVRRWLAIRKRERVRGIWPILAGSESPPPGWPGWPDGKKFAVVLTHDVEGVSGLAKCRQLMQLEKSLGFCSAFNFIPQGDYRVSKELRAELVANGFEVGVHDLYHDGKLYRSRSEFSRNAREINRFAREWGATGFRSGFMLNRLDWIHDLEIQYDASTFDTDPFEPQPEGVGTIFPFWVPAPNPNNGAGRIPKGQTAGRGYVELPYTLPQDSTLFLLLSERHPDIWFQKVDWIARHGGMALLDTHPDYMDFGGEGRNPWEYSVEQYRRLLEYLKTRYAGTYWHALPSQVARLVIDTRAKASKPENTFRCPAVVGHRGNPKIWIDLDNTPHVPFFEPIMEELQARGYPVVVTARDAFQVCELADKKHLPYTRVGRHYGKSRILKAAGLGYRAMQLVPFVLREKPAIGVSHGARSQLLLGNLLHIPTLLLEDYEHARFPVVMRPTWVMAPDVIPTESLCRKNGNVRKYSGIKEDVYAWKLVPDAALQEELGCAGNQVVVTVRPPATEAHYHNPESEVLFNAFMARACSQANVKVILLPRNQKQADQITSQFPQWFEGGKTVIPKRALDGMNLIWHSDLVVSGGGTMNREAAALGIPVYSIFRGTIGAVDRDLNRQGRLILIETVADVREKICLTKRPSRSVAEVTSKRTLTEIVDAIVELAEQCRS